MMQLAELFVEEFDLKLNQLRRYTKHGPSIGRYIEILILNLLKKYFPKSLSYSSGFVQGMNPLIKNNISSQVDIICYDQFNFPIVFDSTEIVVVPSKSVRGLIEIKSNLNSNSIKQILDLSNNKTMHEIPTRTKIYLLATKSSISIEKAFVNLKSYYENKENKIVRLIGGVYSLDWNGRIYCSLIEKEGKIIYNIMHLQNVKSGLAPFVLDLIFDLFGDKALHSIANITAGQLNKVVNSVEIVLYSSNGKL